MEQINYERLIPTEPQEDVVSFALQNGAFQNSYLIYKADWGYVPLEERTRPVVRVACSECGREFTAQKIQADGCNPQYAPAPFGWRNELTGERVISGQKTSCPLCGGNAKTIHIGNIGHSGEIVEDTWVSSLSRLPVESRRDRLVLTDWCIRQCINKRGGIRYEVLPYTAWVVEEKKVVRLMGYTKTMNGSISLFGSWEQRKTFSDVCGRSELVTPWDKSLLEGTTAENCKLDLYQETGGRHLVGYLALWRKRPAVENLLMQGCGNLLEEWISDETDSYGYHGGIPKLTKINWKEKRPAQMLGLTKEEFQYLRKMRWSTKDLERYKLVRDHGTEVRLPDDMKLLRKHEPYELNQICLEIHGAGFWRTLRYMEKQKQHWHTLRDYWNMAEKLGWDMTDNLVRWPRDLHAYHDRAMREQKHKKEESLRAAFEKRSAQLDRFAWEADGLLIRPCRDQQELIEEGKYLHHCVAGYAEDHAKGSTAIFFIRKADQPDEPYFTLEFDEKNLNVRQNRGLRNCDRTQEVTAFETAWLEWVRSTEGKTRKKKRETAA